MKVLSAIYGVLLIVLGFFVLLHPFASMFAIGCMVGIFLLIGGINSIIAGVKGKGTWDIVMGVLTIIAAIAILSSYVAGFLALNVLVIMMAVVVLLQGIADIMAGVAAKKAGESWGLQVVAGVLFIILSIMLFMNPITGLFMMEGVVAATLMMQGIDQLLSLG